VVCVRCHRSPWWRVVVVCIVGMVRLDAWVLVGVKDWLWWSWWCVVAREDGLLRVGPP
jgi:hypothetical protein